jgi:hypothetical protein
VKVSRISPGTSLLDPRFTQDVNIIDRHPHSALHGEPEHCAQFLLRALRPEGSSPGDRVQPSLSLHDRPEVCVLRTPLTIDQRQLNGDTGEGKL